MHGRGILMSMRRVIAIIALLPTLAFGQSRSGAWDAIADYAGQSADIASGKSVFQVSKPDILVQVRHHPLGADIFEISAVQPNYPGQLMADQVNRLCQILNDPPRGLQVFSAQIGDIRSTRATFATDGVIDPAHGVLRIEPIIQAFAGAPAPNTVHGLTILF